MYDSVLRNWMVYSIMSLPDCQPQQGIINVVLLSMESPVPILAYDS